MIISGLQKMTLLDYPGKIACTVFTYGCNFRCPFCHNAALVIRENESQMSREEFFSFLKKRQGILEGVCITGGEPTLHKDLPEFIEKIKQLNYLVKLDTNGYNPEVLKKILDKKSVDYVAMDIKNSLSKYAVTTGLKSFDESKIIESINLIKNSGVEHEFRTTVLKSFHTYEDILSCAELTSDSKYFLQQFKDSGDLICSELEGYSEKQMKEICNKIAEKGYNITLRES